MTPAGFYVYELRDPRDGKAFYVGKGSGGRAWQHEADVRAGRWQNIPKCERIREILEAGHPVDVEIIKDGMDEGAAFALEMERIVEARETLTNVVVPRVVPKVCRTAADVTPQDVERFIRIERERLAPKPFEPGRFIDRMAQMPSVILTGPAVVTPRRALMEAAMYLSAVAQRVGWESAEGRGLLEAVVALQNLTRGPDEPLLEVVPVGEVD